MNKISLSTLIAYNSPRQAQQIVAMFGLQPTNSRAVTAKQLNRLMMQNNGAVLQLMADVHPHRELIVKSLEATEDGTQVVDGEEIMNGTTKQAETKEEIQEKEAKKKKYLEWGLIGLGGLVLGVALFKRPY